MGSFAGPTLGVLCEEIVNQILTDIKRAAHMPCGRNRGLGNFDIALNNSRAVHNGPQILFGLVPHAALQKFTQGWLVEHGHTEALGLGKLRSWVVADDDVVGDASD
jgi:hypothetical protein